MNPKQTAKLTKTLYRTYLRSCADIEKDGKVFWLRSTTSFPMWGESIYGKNVVEHLDSMFPFTRTCTDKILAPTIGSMFLNADQVSAIVKNEFRAPFTPDRLTNSFPLLRMLRDPAHLVRKECYSSIVTEGIRVEICSKHLRRLSEQQVNKNVYAYRTRLENIGKNHVQLLARYFTFRDSTGDVVKVPRDSAGVVGKTPILAPGQAFEYCSGVVLQSGKGVMSGGFQMVTRHDDDQKPKYFDAIIAPLMLLHENKNADNIISDTEDKRVL